MDSSTAYNSTEISSIPHQLTTLRWYNATDNSKTATADIGRYEDIPYGSAHPGMKHAHGKPPHPQFGQWQRGIACSRTSRTIVGDVDHPERWNEGKVFVELGDWRDVATSYREDGRRAHLLIVVPEDLVRFWPAQSQTVWGDCKSNGFSYSGGVHYSGMRYIENGRPPIVADEALMHALAEDRIFLQGGHGTGAMAGTWEDDAYQITGDSQLTADIASMVANGLDDEQIQARLDVILAPLAEPWTPGQIQGKINSARRKGFDKPTPRGYFSAEDGGIFAGAAARVTRQNTRTAGRQSAVETLLANGRI
jgi:hypothetical protein